MAQYTNWQFMQMKWAKGHTELGGLLVVESYQLQPSFLNTPTHWGLNAKYLVTII